VIRLMPRIHPHIRQAMASRFLARNTHCSIKVQKGRSLWEGSMPHFLGGIVGVLAALANRNLVTGALVGIIVAKMPGVLKTMGRRKSKAKLERCIYRIYRYLSNQVSSGVHPMDALKTVYRIPRDTEIREWLISLSARLELTHDLEAAFQPFRERFRCMEVESLYTALYQGIHTGNAGDLLEKQEEYLFSKYMSRMQAETESSRYKAFFAALVFSSVLCILFAIPMIMQVGDAVNAISGP
ncbi:MAG TPA: hypothetical protein DD727_07295, partial [Clostridiales bacterium]|nr:hypothetical protein [Clostridiales bacterium]